LPQLGGCSAMALENMLKRSGIGNHLQNVDYFLLMVYWWIHIHVVYGNLGCLLLFIDSTSQSWLASGGIPQLLGRKTLGGHCQDQLQHYLGVSGSMQMWICGFDQIMVWYLWHQAARGSKFDVSYSTLKDGKVDFCSCNNGKHQLMVSKIQEVKELSLWPAWWAACSSSVFLSSSFSIMSCHAVSKLLVAPWLQTFTLW